MLLLYGAAKVGKTKALEDLPNCLIIDTEKGTRAISGMKVEVNSLSELMALMKELKKDENKGVYQYVALDTIDNVVMWIERHIISTNPKADGTLPKSIADMPYGGGWSQTRDKTLDVIKALGELTDALIIIAHRDRKIIGESSVEVATTNLDLPGKLRNQLMAAVDATGYVYRKDGELRVSFVREEGDDQIEAGSRIAHLTNTDIDLDWTKIYKQAL